MVLDATSKSGVNFLLNSIMENCLDIVTVKDTDLNYIVCNKSFLELFKISEDVPVQNKSIYEIFPEEKVDFVEKHFKQVIEEGETQVCRLELCKDNNLQIFEIVSNPIINNGKIEGILSISRDITKEIIIEKQKELFVASLTHDLKNSVQAQTKSLTILSKGLFGNFTPEQKELIDMTLESSANMQNMLYTTMSAYKYDKGIINLNKEIFNPEKVIINCIREVKSLSYEKNIEILFECEIEDKKKELCADANQIRSVISNMLNNSINYAFKNTVIKINLARKDDIFIFSFETNSPEITEDIKEYIFDKYVAATSNYKKLGVGLGLFLSKKVIDAHSGKIFLTANGETNRFTFELPANI